MGYKSSMMDAENTGSYYKQKEHFIPLGKVQTSFGKSLKYTCLMASVADILFFGTHYRTITTTQCGLLQQIMIILFDQTELYITTVSRVQKMYKLNIEIAELATLSS